MSTQIPQIQHQDLAQSRLAVQFRESTNLIGYIRALIEEGEDLEQVFQDILCLRNLDVAENAQLDTLGEIIGRARTFEETVANPFFGFDGSIAGESFGTIGDSNVGSEFRSISSVEFESQILDDDSYRVLLRGKILTNKTNTSINDIIDIALIGINATGVVISEGDATFTLTYTSALTDTEKLILTRTDYMTKPAGVSVFFADTSGPFA